MCLILWLNMEKKYIFFSKHIWLNNRKKILANLFLTHQPTNLYKLARYAQTLWSDLRDRPLLPESALVPGESDSSTGATATWGR